MNYWISWVSPLPLSVFELHSPWWVSGYDPEGKSICCAALKAGNTNAAVQKIVDAYDNPPKGIEIRFCESKARTWSPFCDRFPKADWMQW